MIELNSITIELSGKTILKDFSLNIEKGQKVAVFGESGSGKSTLLKALIGMHLPSKGFISFFGQPFVAEFLCSIRTNIFYLPQDITAQGEETVADFLKIPFGLAINRSRKFSNDRLQALLLKLRLGADLVHQPLYKLSGGERKRVGLLQGLLLERSIMLVDEPTAGVDTANRDVIGDLLFEKMETTVIMVTHDEQMIERSDVKVELKPLELTGGGM